MYQLNAEQEDREISSRYKDLLRDTYEKLSKEDVALIRNAFDLALDAHKNQRRKSGEPYIFHPIAVAKIVASQIGLGSIAIAASLLHDVVEDTHYKLKDIAEYSGKVVAKIVEGLTKISKIGKKKYVSLQAENYKKLLLTLNQDPRVILIKIADRLHNMQTVENVPLYKQKKIASETLYIYAPLAHRLGLYNIKNDLEDLSLKYVDPLAYKNIRKQIISSKEQQKSYVKYFSKRVAAILKEKIDLRFKITGRPKSIYSIHKKMLKKSVTFEEVYDKFAIRIVYESSLEEEKFSAWEIYSAITNIYPPNPTRIRDWITQPKNTGYEALHITVMGPLGRWVEIQIRSDRMDEIAERGYAAHFKYKQSKKYLTGFESWLDKLKEILENENTNAVDFVEDFKLELFTEEIFVFTPKGEIKSLPRNSCALDFAFAIHTDIGLHCRGVKINGKIKSLDTRLKSGDQVEILVSKVYRVHPSWLDIATTTKAKYSIRTILKIREKETFEQGKLILKRKMNYLKLKFNDKFLREMIRYFGLGSAFDLFYKIGTGNIDNESIRKFLRQRNRFFPDFTPKKTKNIVSEEEKATTLPYSVVFGREQTKEKYTLAQCCNPIEGQEIFGFKKGKNITVHSALCPNALSLQSQFSNQIISAKWSMAAQQEFRIMLNINGSDQKGILGKIIAHINKFTRANIYNIHIDTHHNIFEGTINLGIRNMHSLENVIESVKKIEGVEAVKRVR